MGALHNNLGRRLAWDIAAVRAGVDLGQCNQRGVVPQTTIVKVTIETYSKGAFQSLVALSGGSTQEQGKLSSLPVRNSAGQTFSLCTRVVLAGQGREDIVAPSPPPPEPPPPEPPTRLPIGGILNLMDFVNVTNPGSKALAQLLAATAGTVQAAATVAVAAAVGASAAAGAVGGAAGGGGGPSALMGAQRNSLYGTLGGIPTDCEAPGATGTGGGWTMGRLGVSDSNPCQGEGLRRRLAKQGGNDGDESLAQQILASAMIDALIGVLMIIGGCVTLHFAVLVWWKYRANHKYYSWSEAELPTFSVCVIKPPGARVGLELSGPGFPFGKGTVLVSRVDDSSVMNGEAALFPGDRILLINGQKPKSARRAAETMCDSEKVFLLVQPQYAHSKRTKKSRTKKRARVDIAISPNDSLPTDSHSLDAVKHQQMMFTNLSDQEQALINRDTTGSWRVETRKLPPGVRKKHVKEQQRLGEKRPAFRSLPEPLCYPNLEITLFAAFSTGMVQASSSVLGTAVAGYATLPRHLWLAISTIVAVGACYANEAYKLFIFFKYHDDACWQEAERPTTREEIDDPLFAALSNLLKVPPIAREQGSFEPPEGNDEEPERTERMLSRALTPLRSPSLRNRLPGDAMAEVCSDRLLTKIVSRG